MTVPRPRPLRGNPPVTQRLSGASGLLVATDFDGTLAPIQDDPDAPLATPENKRALRRLAAHPGTVVAVVSGRALTDLRPRVGLADIVYGGNHGLEIDRGGKPRVHPEAQARRPLLQDACDAILEAVGEGNGVHVEDKGLTATIHHRDADEATRERLLAAAQHVVASQDEQLHLSEGKANLELRPAVDWDKGSAMLDLAGDAPHGWRVVYIGDDETDEDAFRALGKEAITIHVGTDRDTAAAYRLDEQPLVAPFLNALASEIHGEAVWSDNGDLDHPARRASRAETTS